MMPFRCAKADFVQTISQSEQLVGAGPVERISCDEGGIGTVDSVIFLHAMSRINERAA